MAPERLAVSGVVIWSSNSVFASRLLELLGEAGVPARIPSAREVLVGAGCGGTIVVDTSDYSLLHKHCPGSRILAVDSRKLLYSSLKILWGVLGPSEALVGIDPGKNIGVAVITHSVLAYSAVLGLEGLVSALNELSEAVREYGNASRVLVGVGVSPTVRGLSEQIAGLASGIGVRVVLVDEHGSNSVKTRFTRSIGRGVADHVNAATVIALRALGLNAP